jgi:hypothetical protein
MSIQLALLLGREALVETEALVELAAMEVREVRGAQGEPEVLEAREELQVMEVLEEWEGLGDMAGKAAQEHRAQAPLALLAAQVRQDRLVLAPDHLALALALLSLALALVALVALALVALVALALALAQALAHLASLARDILAHSPMIRQQGSILPVLSSWLFSRLPLFCPRC